MFKIGKSDSYFWPVTVEFPVDGGKRESETFDAEFKRLGHDRVKQIRKSIESGDMDEDAVAREVVIGWKAVVDSNGEDVVFSIKALEELFEG